MEKDVLKELVKFQFPIGVLDCFELVSVQQEEGKLLLQLDELPVKPHEHKDKNLESKGFLPPVHLEDFPIRELSAYLVVRRRKWIDIQTGKTYSNSFKLTAQGTSYTQEFGAFLKEVAGYYPG